MNLDKDVRDEIQQLFRNKYGRDLDVEVIVRKAIPPPEEVQRNNGKLEFLGNVKSGVVFALKSGWKILQVLVFIIEVLRFPSDIQYYLPKAYDFVVEHGSKMFSGDTGEIRMASRSEDGYLVLKSTWRDEKATFDQDHSLYAKGDLRSLFTSDMVLFPATGSAVAVSGGTTSTSSFFSSWV